MALSPTISSVNAQATKKLTTATGPSDPHSIDPQLASDQRDVDLSNPMFPGLTILDQDSGQDVPGITTGWDISADGLVYTFHLIKDIP
jgi:ABC-type oligopeptide transport system substrate-binding subunit